MSSPRPKSIEDFLQSLPTEERHVTQHLRNIVYDCIPHCNEKLSYNVPYFSVHKPICFIWPGAVLWGKKRMYDGVRFGFTKGHLLNNESTYFDQGKRKFVIYRDFKNPSEVDVDLLKMYLFNAAEVDEQFGR